MRAAEGFPVVLQYPPHKASPDRRMVIGGFGASMGSPKGRGLVPPGYGTVPWPPVRHMCRTHCKPRSAHALSPCFARSGKQISIQ